MNMLIIETKNGHEYWAHVSDYGLHDFDSEMMYGKDDAYLDVFCEKTKRTLVFKRDEISVYSFGELKEESQ